MNKCISCGKETENPKFCSRSCSAKTNNHIHPKRWVEGVCVCGEKISKKRKFCNTCREKFSKRTRHPVRYGYKYVKGTRMKNKLRAVQLAGGKCVICGYNRCTASMQFHHLVPSEKSFTISANLNKAWRLIEHEVKKCILVCANCHGEIESGLLDLSKYMPIH